MVSFTVYAQRADTVKNKYLPTSVRIGTDVFSLIRSGYDETYSGWEANADVDFYKYYLALDYGSWGRTFHTDSGLYKNNGHYFRIGADVNFLAKDPDRNMLFFGFRYAQSNFSENLTTTVYDSLWGSLSRSYTNSDAKAHWLELTTGLRVKMWKNFWMGYTARYKFGLSTSNTPEMIPGDVPGYGRNDGKSAYWGFNYQIFWRIPIRKEKSISSKK